ncbi:hypothetical protein WPS_18250 [Vulcanimicrobium alpinum]|uniref:VWA domain-containing protein n=1 Tax=Vulcanimicrobium alpinum TaxID=3016050 RepID=A0AAN1XX20_UNVUL|nr:VWA domain-containing protein [Vulcanimicrobium alpinum]BDE06549.1 hypothetical protein WPS_18250 [Vulcanimicrobium alpinum]
MRRVRRGRALRRMPARTGSRIDIRRTLRESLQTGGDPVLVRRLAPPRRNPGFVAIVDGSRSMAPHAGAMLQFARALVRRTRRARAFAFSTSVRDVTEQLRDASRPLGKLGTAWGGGTRIGSALAAIVAAYGSLFTRDTVVLIASDGLDVGDAAALDAALRAVRARAGAIVWLHPHAGTPGFRAATAGMRAALPLLRALVPASSADDFLRLTERISTPHG